MPFTDNMILVHRDGNAGMVTTTTGSDLLHTLPTGRSARITKILAYNGGAANITLQIGTLDNAGNFVQLLPTLTVISALDNEWGKDEIPTVEFIKNSSAGVSGRTGSIYMVGSVAGVLVSIELDEKL